MARDTLLGFPSHSLPYRYHTVITVIANLTTLSADSQFTLFYWKKLYPSRLLGEMHMGENMILAEAVIPGTLAAITELQVGIVRIRAAAHLSLIHI